MKRYWINQPSTLQDYHKFHGINVLGPKILTEYVTVYFLLGNTTSMRIASIALSEKLYGII